MQFILQKKSLILSLIFFTFSLGAFLFLHKATDNSRKDLQSMREKWQIEAIRRESLKSIANSIEATKAERTQLETHFAQSSNVVPFLDAIEKLAEKAGVKVEIISVNAPENNPSLLVEVKMSGSFEAIHKSVLLLENSPYELQFVSADIRNSGAENSSAGGESSRWNAVFRLKLLSFIN